MSKEEKNILTSSLTILDEKIRMSDSMALYKNYRYSIDSISDCKAMAKSEELHHDDYQVGLLALVLSNLGQIHENTKKYDITPLINVLVDSNKFSENELTQLRYYLNFFSKDCNPNNSVEMVLLDCKYSYLGLTNGLERMALMQLQTDNPDEQKFDELKWEQYCKSFYLKHNYYTKYAIEKYGILRSKNFSEIERRIEKIELERARSKNLPVEQDSLLSDKEGETLFKIALRNYLNLVALADRKAHLLIEVNSILASVIIGFTIKKADNSSYYILPTTIVLVIAGLTIFYAILASKPLGEFKNANVLGKEPFFFGSFDRIDPNFKNVTWEKYSFDINQLFKGDKELIFNELIKESFQVRKVLSKKFGFLSIAYKIFIIGQLLGIGLFIVMIIFRH